MLLVMTVAHSNPQRQYNTKGLNKSDISEELNMFIKIMLLLTHIFQDYNCDDTKFTILIKWLLLI